MCDNIESVLILFSEESIGDFVLDENIFLSVLLEDDCSEENIQFLEPATCTSVADLDADIDHEKKRLLDEGDDEEVEVDKKLRLYANPDIDTGKSSIFFPNNLSRLLNDGNTSAMANLFRKNCHRQAMIQMNSSYNSAVSVARYIALMSFVDSLYCDSMNCVQSTSVDGNKITAKTFFTYTDVSSMYARAPVVVTDPMFRPAFVGKRVHIMGARLNLYSQPLSVQREVKALLQSDEDIQVYGTQDVTLTFDRFSQKILGAQFINKMTSVGYQGKRYYLQ